MSRAALGTGIPLEGAIFFPVATGIERIRNTLTPRQEDYMQVIEKSVRARGYAPTMRELADALGVNSTNAVSQQLDFMERKGALHRLRDYTSRSIIVCTGETCPVCSKTRS
jgi:SOS-response transcriptional repressor LexA